MIFMKISTFLYFLLFVSVGGFLTVAGIFDIKWYIDYLCNVKHKHMKRETVRLFSVLGGMFMMFYGIAMLVGLI